MSSKRAWPVAIFAHDEEKNIVACLESLAPAAPGWPLEIFVLANGCTDRTEQWVAEYARDHANVRLVSIARGDKAHAWNVYVHDLAPDEPVHVFMDGDVQACPRALVELHAALQAHPAAHAAAALPQSGRSRETLRRAMLREHGLMGNLYALRQEFMTRLQRHRVHLPVGLVFEDGLVGALALWNLEPQGDWDLGRVVPCPAAGFRFDSLSWFRGADWRLYWRRRVRYANGRYQNQMLGRVLKAKGLEGLPASTDDLYRGSSGELRIGRVGVDAMFDWIALRRIARARAR